MLKKITGMIAITAAALLLAGCATSVPVTLTRPAELDLQGAKTIAVLPFRLSNDTADSNKTSSTVIIIFGSWGNKADPDEVAISDHLTLNLEQKLLNASNIQLVGSNAVKAAIENGTPIPTDVYLTGKIATFSSNDSESSRKEIIDEKEQTVSYYTRDVSITIRYQVIDAKTNKVIASKERSFSSSSSPSKDSHSLPSALSIIKPSLDTLLTAIMKELQPYEIVKYITMKSDKTKDPEMKRADEFVKAHNISAAKELYLKIYETKGNPVAGYNVAMLLQASGKLEEAKAVLLELAAVSTDKDVMNALKEVEYEIKQAEKLRAQSL